MINKPRSIRLVLVSVVMIILASLACSIGSGDVAQDDLQSTIVALELTKTYLENQSPQETPPSNEPINNEPPPQPKVQDTPVVENPEVQPDLPDIIFEGIQFSFDPFIANSVNTAVIPGQNLGEDFMPFETYPTHFEFTFNQYAVPNHFREAILLIYPIEEYRAISVFAQDTFNALQSTLINRPGGSGMSALPFLPLLPAAQLFSAQVSYFDFQNGSGVRYLTMHGQDIYPVDNQHLIYTYQGMTEDGRYYISAVFPIIHPGLPDDGSDLIGEDYLEFSNNWEIYLASTMRFLGEQPLQSFTPSLELLDEMIASIKIER